MSDELTFRVVFDCPRGFVTDFGKELPLVGGDSLPRYRHIPRYGVWKLDRPKGKMQVTLTTNDLHEATREAER